MILCSDCVYGCTRFFAHDAAMADAAGHRHGRAVQLRTCQNDTTRCPSRELRWEGVGGIVFVALPGTRRNTLCSSLHTGLDPRPCAGGDERVCHHEGHTRLAEVTVDRSVSPPLLSRGGKSIGRRDPASRRTLTPSTLLRGTPRAEALRSFCILV